MSQRIGELVQRLFTDSAFRVAFLKSPEVSHGEGFTEEERRVIVRLRLRLAASDGVTLTSDDPRDGGWP